MLVSGALNIETLSLFHFFCSVEWADDRFRVPASVTPHSSSPGRPREDPKRSDSEARGWLGRGTVLHDSQSESSGRPTPHTSHQHGQLLRRHSQWSHAVLVRWVTQQLSIQTGSGSNQIIFCIKKPRNFSRNNHLKLLWFGADFEKTGKTIGVIVKPRKKFEKKRSLCVKTST